MDVDVAVLASVMERSLRVDPLTLADWSAEEPLAGDGQGLGVFQLTGSAARLATSPKNGP
jgi:hypothetical protein